MADLYVPRVRDDDEISLISMREVIPSPIDYDDEDGDEFSIDSSPSTPTISKSQTLPLNFGSLASSHGSGRGLPFWLVRTQKYSAYAFLSFVGIHGCTAALSPLLLGVDSGNSSLLLARTYFYQATPYSELLLIPGTLVLHLASSVALRVHRHFAQRARYGGRAPLSLSTWRWRNFSAVSRTGWIAVPFLAAHAALMRLVPLWVDGDSSQVGLEYLAHGFWQGRWGKWIGGAFYVGFVGVASHHIVYGLAGYWKVPPQRKRKLLGAATVGTAALWLGGLSRVVVQSGRVGGYLGRHYDHFYQVFFRRV